MNTATDYALAESDPIRRVRVGTLMGAGVWVLFFVFVWLLHVTLLSFPDIRAVSLIFVTAVVLNLALAGLAGYWGPWRVAVYVYEVLNAVLVSLIFVYLGGSLEIGAIFVAYGLFVIHTWVIRPDASVYVTATVCGLCYAVLCIAEACGLVTSTPVLHRPPPTTERIAIALFGLLTLNALALYASRYAAELRRLGERLRGLVAERTRELADTNAQLEAKAKALEVKQQELEEFVYRITHDLKTPVNNVLLFADLLLESPQHAFSEEVRGRLERIRQGSSRAENMIQDLWRFVQITSEAEVPEWIELDALVTRALESLEARIEGKGIRVTVGPLPRVWGRQKKLGHVVANLLSNAVTYTPPSGEIAVSGRVENGCSVFCVRDNGIGIPEDYYTRIFELYGQVPPQATAHNGGPRGTGVGLAIVKRIVEEHEGSVWVESELGVGSGFWVRLPLRNAGQPP